MKNTNSIGQALPNAFQPNLWGRRFLIVITTLFALTFLVAPLVVVLTRAFEYGWSPFWKAVTEIYTVKALRLTALTTVLAVTCNTLFGLCAAWALTRFQYKGRGFLITLIDLPFAISPIIAGLIFILTYGRLGWLHPYLVDWQLRIVFNVPGVVLATIFVTLPFVAREIVPVLAARGTDEEQAAVLMGAGFFTVFFKVTFPHIRWALVYSLILCAARAMGEFGAVSVVSGHLRGKTNTLPLHIEILYNEHKFSESFAVSTILVATSVIILTARNVIEQLAKKEDESNVFRS